MESNIQINKILDKRIDKRKRSFIINLVVGLISLIGILILKTFGTFLDGILVGSRLIIFYAIIIIGLMIFILNIIFTRMLEISDLDLAFLALNGTKDNEYFSKIYISQIPNDKSNDKSSDKSIDKSFDTPIDVNKYKPMKYKLSRNGKLISIFNFLGEIITILYLSFFVVSLLFTFVLFPATVIGDCMEPLLYGGKNDYSGDKIIASRLNSYDIGDVVVFQYDDDIQIKGNVRDNELLVKRLIAKAGQKFEVIDGHIYIDDCMLNEDYVVYGYSNHVNYDLNKVIDNNSNKEEIDYKGNNIIPEGYCILLGDNRLVANDSRYFGLVKESQICGVVTFYKGRTSGWERLE
ncbi:MAG: signal peptidase I [Bacilli bacterium]|nr:signal peptidase I [Bacilli bacterium]